MELYRYPLLIDNCYVGQALGECGKVSLILNYTLFRYWPGRSWNITFRWTAKNYIFPRRYIFPKRAALRENIIMRENITILALPTRDISSVPVDICYIRWSKWMISSNFDGALWLSQSLVTRLGVCVQNNLNANLTALRAFYYDVLLINCCVLWLRGAFLSGSISKYGITVIVVVALFLIEFVMFSRLVNITLFLTGCLCALNYMSKPDHLISDYIKG